jgi:hypothetical protein
VAAVSRYLDFRELCIAAVEDGIECADVRFGSKADVTLLNFDVRFTPESGRCRVAVGCPRRAKSRYRTKSPYSLRRHYDGDGMRHRGADFDDEWRDKLVEFHALADTLTKQHPKRIFLSRKIPFELLALISCNYWK